MMLDTGSDNLVADALSCVEVNVLHSSHVIDLKQMAAAQEMDPDLVQFQTTTSSFKLKAMPLPTSDGTILCDVPTGILRPYVPEQFRRSVSDSLHMLSHPSVRATQHLETTCFVWPGINAGVRR